MISPNIFVPSNQYLFTLHALLTSQLTGPNQNKNGSSVMVSCLSATVLNFVPGKIKFRIFFFFFTIPSHLLFHLPRIRSLTPSVLSQCCNSGSTDNEWNFFDFKSVHSGQQKTRLHEFTMMVTLQIRHADPTGFTIVDKPSHCLQIT